MHSQRANPTIDRSMSQVVEALLFDLVQFNQENRAMSSSKKPPAPPPVNRSAVTGRFVTPQYAKSHPRTTVTEHNKPKSGRK